MNQKGFVNIIIVIVGVIILAGAAGYFIVNQRTPSPTPAPSPISSPNPTPTPTPTPNPTPTSTPKSTESKTLYPATVYIPLTAAERAAKEKSFGARNGLLWKVTFDDYGFIATLYTDDEALLAKYKLTDGQTMDAAAIDDYRQFVLKNADFFGVEASSELKLEHGYLQGIQRGLKAEEKVAGMPFIYSYESPHPARIIITHSDKQLPKLYITGHFWPKVLVPTTPKFSTDQLKKKLVGTQYTYQPILYPCDPVPGGPGCPPQESGPKIFTITEAMSQDVQGVLGPYFWKNQGTNKLELRLGYIFGFMLPNNNPLTLIVDAITGEVAKPTQ